MKRRVSFYGDTEASTSGGEAVTNPDADVEQMSTSSGRPPSLVTTFANTLRSRANRRKSRSSFDSRDSTGSRRFSFRMRGSSHNNSMNGGADGRRDGLTKTLSKRISLAEKQMIEQEHQNSSWFKWWHAVFIFCGVSLIACLCQLFLPYPYGLHKLQQLVSPQKDVKTVWRDAFVPERQSVPPTQSLLFYLPLLDAPHSLIILST